ncbi:hypothetical protein GCM10010174_73980 [Kutzneria viridogrisea]|uniref:Nitroreductase domain-containing protein n=2 Tax=Kutzneria TaxID=43356 RepID=W5WFK1_9PSEU|nr:hypothetical protein [Kutzneria albida]AHH96944.1 hypothetical protein KALB_3580 [Kutzneria albida DSM 43870]MBA8932091.1 hypothetical protein [Kutzneria viridogrisea]
MRGWTRRQCARIIAAARRVPVLSPERPWVVQFDGHTVRLYEKVGQERHDSAGLDRLLTCGMALVAVVHAVRELGWQVEVDLDQDPAAPDLVAAVVPTEHRVSPLSVPPCLREARLELINDRGRVAALAAVLLDASRRLDGDHLCARELAPWLTQATRARVTVPAHRHVTVEPYPDAVCAIAANLLARPMVIAVTDGDDRRDHVLAGAAMQLAAEDLRQWGMSLHPVVRPMHLRDLRLRLMTELGLGGFPQALLGLSPPVTC